MGFGSGATLLSEPAGTDETLDCAPTWLTVLCGTDDLFFSAASQAASMLAAGHAAGADVMHPRAEELPLRFSSPGTELGSLFNCVSSGADRCLGGGA